MTADQLGPWKEGIWSEWASKNNIQLPNITPLEPKLTSHKVYSKEKISELEHGLSLTIRDYVNEFGEMPIWAQAFINRGPSNILTKSRSNVLTGHIVNHSGTDRSYTNKIFEVYKKGGYILDIKSLANKKLLSRNIWFIEKELITVNLNTVLVYRYLDDKANLLKITTIRWSSLNDSVKNLRVEVIDKDSQWHVVRQSSIKFDDVFSNELDDQIFLY